MFVYINASVLELVKWPLGVCLHAIIESLESQLIPSMRGVRESAELAKAEEKRDRPCEEHQLTIINLPN